MASTHDTTPGDTSSLTGWIWSSNASEKKISDSSKESKIKDGSDDMKESDVVRHRKQLAQILRYIATMHHSLGGDKRGGGNGHSFLRHSHNHHQRYWQSSFYQELSSSRSTTADDDPWGVLLSTQNFRILLSMQAESATPLFDSPPFSFYAATTSTSAPNRKRAWSDAFRSRNNINQNNGNNDGKACWLRLTRLTTSEVPEPPSLVNPAVKRYLQQWRDQNADEFQHCRSLRDILTLETLERTPKIPPTEFARTKEIKAFMRKYKQYLRKRAYQQALEPMYNALFEWVQQTQHSDELVWGLGHARMITGDNTIVNGPLLEILMEVELARDGALLVRPREHTGVALNREVVTALMPSDDAGSVVSAAASTSSGHQRLTQLHRSVAELDPLQMAPGQPTTYIPFLKRMVVELSSGGSFQMSTKAASKLDHPPGHNKMLVTEAWCLYSRPKPSSVWARDAMAFADQLLLPPNAKGGLELPKATWALTHGASALDRKKEDNVQDSENQLRSSSSLMARLGMIFQGAETEAPDAAKKQGQVTPIVFPLPTSDSQNRIADLLLRQQYPAIVTEGPPGTGKTHTIANMISAYLCQGKRVLVTSKSAPALSVIRTRLPSCVQDLCVDVSMSELVGMRQLQRTVERLANRISCVSTHMETEKCQMILRNIEALEQERSEIDEKLADASDRVRAVIQQLHGQTLVSGLVELNEKVPWLMKTTAPWTVDKLTSFRDSLSTLLEQQNDGMARVFVGGCTSPPPEGLVSVVASNAGVKLSTLKIATRKALASVPLLGSVFGATDEDTRLQEQLATITVDDRAPETKDDWQQVLQVLRFEEALESLHQTELQHLIKDDWPDTEVYDRIGQQKQQRIIKRSIVESLNQALRLKELAITLGTPEEIQFACECSVLDARRSMIASQIQHLAEDLVDAKVVAELSKSFSAEAQSALIRFSQLAGKARFSRSSQPSKMTARQRRHRQEYLDAFDRCVRYIPCWILTSTQICDYLPPECLFDLVVIDEASQSDITVLPSLLRGKQWLIVGDGKQVSPTESFISEDSIDSLRAALPPSPLEDSLLPGQSFFDLSAQAFPRGRVVLSEHFRCAPEIINFSNEHFYDGRLVPLRLPTSKERLSPSLMDVRVAGAKVGKTNEVECDEIVRLVQSFVNDAASELSPSPRSIGIISLLGDDQSRLIRGRLLDRVGPHKFKEHDILIGDPPTFQGAERDIVFLSMVCSPGSVPTQNRLMHAQRVNVALSRARDRMVLVRSIDAQHIPNNEDVKHQVIEFFEEVANAATNNAGRMEDDAMDRKPDAASFSFRVRAEALLEKMLKERGYAVRRMGVVWNHALCVEHPGSSARAGLCIENAGESKDEWTRVVTQQRSIERVGWKCLRVDGLSMLTDHHSTMKKVLAFLSSAGVEEPPLIYDALEEEEEEDAEMADRNENEGPNEDENVDLPPANANEEAPTGVVVISSDDDNDDDNPKADGCVPDVAASQNMEAMLNDQMDANQFGQVVQLDFLQGGRQGYSSMYEASVPDTAHVPASRGRRGGSSPSRRRRVARRREEAAYLGDQSDVGEGDANEAPRPPPVAVAAPAADGNETVGDDEVSSITTNNSSKRRRYRRLDKYSRDGRWFPGRPRKEDDREDDWYDTDSDLQGDDSPEKDEDEDYRPPVEQD